MKHSDSRDNNMTDNKKHPTPAPVPENLDEQDTHTEPETEQDVADTPEITSEEHVNRLQVELEKLTAEHSETFKNLIKTQNKLATREAEFEKLADAYRKLRESTDKMEADHNAEFDNFRRRTEEEKKRIGDKAVSDLMLALLPSLDNFDRAMQMLQGASEIAAVRSGVEMILNNLRQTLEGQGLERMQAVGTEFNPELHNAVATMETTQYPDGYVADEMLPGYSVKGILVRPAMVRVARAPEEE